MKSLRLACLRLETASALAPSWSVMGTRDDYRPDAPLGSLMKLAAPPSADVLELYLRGAVVSPENVFFFSLEPDMPLTFLFDALTTLFEDSACV